MADETAFGRRIFLKSAASLAATAPLITSACAQGAGGGAEVVMGADLPDRAVGRPMPNWVSLPESVPVYEDRGQRAGIAIMGVGLYALGQIMPRLHRTKNLRLAALVSGNPDKARKVAAAYGLPEDAIYSYADFDRIAEDKRVDAVYNILPTGLHEEWTLRAFKAGKHVLCEKPMAISSEQAARMIAAGEQAGKKLMMGYRVHFDPVNARAREMIAAGEIGKVTHFTSNQHRMMGYDSPDEQWRRDRSLAGRGPLEDWGIYGLNGSLLLTGDVPVEISASTVQPEGDPRFIEIVDLTTSRIRFKSGMVAQLSTSYSSAFINDNQIVGTDGVIRMDPGSGYGGNTLQLRKNGAQMIDAGDTSTQFVGMLEHFGDAILNGSQIIVPGEMGLRDMRLIEAIYASADAGRPVQLNADMTMKG